MRNAIWPDCLEHARERRIIILVSVVQANPVFTVDSVGQVVEVINRLLPAHHADHVVRRVFKYEVSQLRANLSGNSGDEYGFIHDYGASCPKLASKSKNQSWRVSFIFKESNASFSLEPCVVPTTGCICAGCFSSQANKI